MTKTPQTEAWVENINYELVPNSDDGWDVRILTGDLIETMFRINHVSFREEDLTIKINYQLLYTPDTTLKPEDEIIRQAVHGVFHSLMVNLLETPH